MKTRFLLPLFLMSVAEAGELSGVLKNNSGVARFEQKNAAQALEEFTAALGDLPYAPEVHFNVATSFLARREYEKALSEYQQTLRVASSESARDRRMRFMAFFNSAAILAEMKKTDEALELYQKALDLEPDSIETKTNIELLTAQQSGGGDGDDKDQDQKDGKGGGKNDQEKNDDKKDDKKKPKDEKKDKPPDKVSNPRPTPRPFKSEELSQQDVRRILEELKRQEEQIRARMQDEQRKDTPPEKDW